MTRSRLSLGPLILSLFVACWLAHSSLLKNCWAAGPTPSPPNALVTTTQLHFAVFPGFVPDVSSLDELCVFLKERPGVVQAKWLANEATEREPLAGILTVQFDKKEIGISKLVEILSLKAMNVIEIKQYPYYP